MTVTSWQDTAISGNADILEAGTFFTSIPFDEGWKVLVDGQEVKGRKIFNAFLGFDLPEGSHEISLTYYPPGMTWGLWITVLSLVLLILTGVLCTEGRFGKKKTLSGEDLEEELDKEEFQNKDEDFLDDFFSDEENVRPEGAIEDDLDWFLDEDAWK